MCAFVARGGDDIVTWLRSLRIAHVVRIMCIESRGYSIMVARDMTLIMFGC